MTAASGRLLVPLGRRKQRPQPGGQHDADGVDAEGEDEDVLPDDADRLARQPHQQRQRLQRIAHEDDVARLGGHVGAGAADRQADVGAGQGRGVVDAVADHGDAWRAESQVPSRESVTRPRLGT